MNFSEATGVDKFDMFKVGITPGDRIAIHDT